MGSILKNLLRTRVFNSEGFKMRVLILVPTKLPSVTGNAITVERWSRSLRKKGVVVNALPTEGLGVSDLQTELRDFRPHLIHVHHAFKAGSCLLNPCIASEWKDIPLVISSAGTDINIDMRDPGKKGTVLAMFRRARLIIVQEHEAEKRLKLALPDRAKRIVFVGQAFQWLGDVKYDLRAAAECAPRDVLFFHPAGIRPVKGNLECLFAMEKVHALRPNVRIVFAGPILDSTYARQFERQIADLNGVARWLTPIPPEGMRYAFAAADVVLNTSFSEGLSNALLEAIAAGRAVLASDIPGNRMSVLDEDGGPPAGWLFNPHDQEDFVRKAVILADDDRLRRTLGEAGRLRAQRWPTPDMEADSLMAVYRSAVLAPTAV